MQDNRKSVPKKLHKNERREDMQVIRTKVSQTEIYIWAGCLTFMAIILTAFLLASLLTK